MIEISIVFSKIIIYTFEQDFLRSTPNQEEKAKIKEKTQIMEVYL